MTTFLTILSQIFELCIVPLLGIFTKFLIDYLTSKKHELDTNIDNALTQKYIDLIYETVKTCVIATNQTYVNALKEQGKFDTEAQKFAFERTYNAIMQILSEDAKTYITEAFGDLETYLTELIEKETFNNKQ